MVVFKGWVVDVGFDYELVLVVIFHELRVDGVVVVVVFGDFGWLVVSFLFMVIGCVGLEVWLIVLVYGVG